MHRLYLILVFFSFLSCDNDSKQSTNALIGGEIINPKDAYVKIFQNGKIIDSTKLDKNNRFSFSIPKASKGLYYFSHGREYQYFYLEPNDSLMLRLNTLDFDESLAFCGAGSEKNNLLVKLFLINEKNSKKSNSYLNLSPDDFIKKQNEIVQEKKILAAKTKQTNALVFSKTFEAVLDVEINYPSYIEKELYPIYHMKQKQLDSFPKLASDFYAFEKNIDFNNEKLISNRNYYLFLDSYFTRKTFLEYFEKREKNTPNTKKKEFVLHKLDHIKNTISNAKVRDNLLQYNIIQYAYENPMDVDVLDAFKDYFKDLTDLTFKNELKRIISNFAQLAQGKPAPKIYLHDAEENITSIAKLANQNKTTVFYFWTIEATQYITGMNSRINALKKAFPKARFIAINIDKSKTDWLTIAKEKGIDTTHLYQLENTEDLAKKLSLSSLSNVIVTAPDGKIITAFENLFSERLPFFLDDSKRILLLKMP